LARARYITHADRPAALAALAAHRQKMAHAAREWSQYFDADVAAALDRLLEQHTVAIIGDYLVAFDLTESWFTAGARFFNEVLVLRISRRTGNTLRNVVAEMARIARVNGCAGLCVGTYGALNARLARAYRRLGFKDAPAQLYKEL